MKQKICVYAICKNEAKFVKRWLDSFQDADYIVVLDTGSTDGTYEMLKEDSRVTRVEQKIIDPWRFDVARNESMKLVPRDADILVCPDLDEIVLPGWTEVIRKYWHDGVNRLRYKYVWSHSETGEDRNIYTFDKIHSKDYHWKYPVHEVLWRDDWENEKGVNVGEEICFHHYQDLEKSRSSYFDLLKLDVEEYPEDSHVRLLYAREFLLRGDEESALKEYMNVLEMPDVDSPDKKLVLYDALDRCAQLYANKEEYNTALWYCQEFIKENNTYREPYFTMANIYNQLNMPTLAEACTLAGFKYGTWKHNWVEQEATWVNLGEELLSISYLLLNKIDEAMEYAKKALEHDPNNVVLLQRYNEILIKKIEENKSLIQNQKD